MTPCWNDRARPPPSGAHTALLSARTDLPWPDTHVDAGLRALWYRDAEPEIFVSFVHSFILPADKYWLWQGAGETDMLPGHSSAEMTGTAEGGELWRE